MRTIIVLRCLGVLLLAAAGMKAHGLAIEPVSAIGWLSSSWFQFGLIQLEMLVGVWLLLAWHLRAAWLAAFVLFSLFGVVSLHQASVGITSCGCFGHVSVHPWHAFAIDLFALAMLWIGRPSRLSLSVTTGNFTGPVKEWLIIATVLVGIFAGGVYLSFGSLDAALVYFRGERLSVRPSVVDVGVGATGQERAFEVELVNWSDAAIEGRYI